MFGDFHFCCPSLTAAGLGDDESLNPEESAYSEARTSFLADDVSAIKLESLCLDSGEDHADDFASDGGVILPSGLFA